MWTTSCCVKSAEQGVGQKAEEMEAETDPQSLHRCWGHPAVCGTANEKPQPLSISLQFVALLSCQVGPVQCPISGTAKIPGKKMLWVSDGFTLNSTFQHLSTSNNISEPSQVQGAGT